MNDVKDFGDYSVKNVKSFMGREGMGFNCSLYRNGKRIGFCVDDASGGEMHPIQWETGVNAKEEQRLLNEHIASLPKVQSSYGMELTIDEGWFVTELVSKFELEKDIRKIKNQCKTKILFRTNNCKRGSYYIQKNPYNEIMAKKLRAKYEDDIEIFNEVFANGDIPSIFD